jgi:beta-lactamase superfamily II metal-dependent hydrolase
VLVTEPFTGLSRFGGALQVLGPTENYYAELVAAHLAEVASGVAAARMAPQTGLLAKARDLLTRFVDKLPIETLTDDVETSLRNDSSVITLVQVDGRRILLTGDAGVPALTAAAECYEAMVGSFADCSLNFFQAPHHGSRRNLGPTILNRVLGDPSGPYGELTSFISSAKADPKHPSPRVVNALIRRGCRVNASEGVNICSRHDIPARPGYVSLTPLTPLAEDDDD